MLVDLPFRTVHLMDSIILERRTIRRGSNRQQKASVFHNVTARSDIEPPEIISKS